MFGIGMKKSANKIKTRQSQDIGFVIVCTVNGMQQDFKNVCEK